MSEKRKIVFISYSWDSPEHQEWVLKLAKDLRQKFGVDVILDQFELIAGADLTHFMESSIVKADKVLVVLTPNYKIKAEERKSGVGYETSMITQQIFESPISIIKFIPILREGTQKTSSPTFLKSKIYHQMDDDNFYINKLYELSKTIYDKPLIEKPELGDVPDFTKNGLDPIIDMANSLTEEEKINNEIDSILDSTKGVELFRLETQKLNKLLKEKTDLYKTNTQINFTYETNNRDTTVIHAFGFSVSFYWREAYSNSIRDASLVVTSWNGFIKVDNNYYHVPFEEPKIVVKIDYNFDLNYNMEVLWKYPKKEEQTTSDLINAAFIFIVDSIKKEKSKKFRK